MSYNTPDVYYQAEQFGLTQVAEIKWAEPDYSFNLGVVWVDEEGNLFYGEDAGCSCPSPFEDFTSKADLDQLTLAELQERLEKRAEEEYVSEWRPPAEDSPYSRGGLRAQVVDTLIKARAAVKK